MVHITQPDSTSNQMPSLPFLFLTLHSNSRSGESPNSNNKKIEVEAEYESFWLPFFLTLRFLTVFEVEAEYSFVCCIGIAKNNVRNVNVLVHFKSHSQRSTDPMIDFHLEFVIGLDFVISMSGVSRGRASVSFALRKSERGFVLR